MSFTPVPLSEFNLRLSGGGCYSKLLDVSKVRDQVLGEGQTGQDWEKEKRLGKICSSGE